MTDEKYYVLIISNEEDMTTDMVIDWLEHFQISYIRINDTTRLYYNQYLLTNDTNDLVVDDNTGKIDLNYIKSYWYRRGRLFFDLKHLNNDTNKTNPQIIKSKRQSYFEIKNNLYYQFEKKHGFGSFHHNTTNKINNLHVAKLIGLKIPATAILTRKAQLISFAKEIGTLITKPIEQGSLLIKNNDFEITGFTALISDAEIRKLPQTFPPSLFQSYIEKAYELRIFYLNDKCFASAIFSQLDDKTKIDFRNYNLKKPNRTPPYQLPNNIEQKLIQLMNKVKMKSGSIDMLVTPNKEYVFLEVNPIGQFYQVSHPCNYYLEKIVAEYLSKPITNEQ